MTFLEWEEANPFGISLDDAQQTWNAGGVVDLLAIGTSVVASSFGSVWIINPGLDGTPTEDTYQANCISDEWGSSKIDALAFGPDGQTQLFVAGNYYAGSFVMYAVTLKVTPGQVDFVHAVPVLIPPALDRIYEIVVESKHRRIVVRTSTGVFWSAIPSKFDQPNGYQWQAAGGLSQIWSVLGFEYGSLALGPGASVVLGIPAPSTTLLSPPSTGPFGFYVGEWNPQHTDLQFAQASVSSTSFNAGRVESMVIDSCRGDRYTLYAECQDWLGQNIYAVLRSLDGGQTWSPVASPGTTVGAYVSSGKNRIVAVSPNDSSIVVLCWGNGPFLSLDGGQTWNLIQGDGLTAAQNAAYFLDLPSDQLAFFVGSDGGVALVSQNQPSQIPSYTVTSKYNMHLRNLKFSPTLFLTPGPATPTSRPYQGMSTGVMVRGVVIGSDDVASSISSQVDPAAPVAAQPWRLLTASNGQFFIATGQLVVMPIFDSTSRLSTWNTLLSAYSDWPGVIIPLDGSSGSLAIGTSGNGDSAVAPVFSPTHSNHDQLLFALAGKNRNLYGLFGDLTGSNMHWTLLVEAPSPISALASRDENLIVVATNDGAIYVCDTSVSVLTPMPMTQAVASSGNFILQLVVQSDTVMFALSSAGTLLRYQGSAWDIVSTVPSNSGFGWLETDWTGISRTVYVATQGALFGSKDNGETWSTEVLGLPAVFGVSDLWFAHEPNGQRMLYMTTLGRSMWRAKITDEGGLPAIRSHITPLTDILWGVIQDGGGLTTGGPIPPWGPDLVLLEGILATALAQTLPGNYGTARSTAALRGLAFQAQQLLEAETPRRRGVLARFFSRWRRSRVSVQTLLRIVTRSSGEISDLQALTVAALAASLSRKQGTAQGAGNLQKALRFVQQHAQSAADNVRLRQDQR